MLPISHIVFLLHSLLICLRCRKHQCQHIDWSWQEVDQIWIIQREHIWEFQLLV